MSLKKQNSLIGYLQFSQLAHIQCYHGNNGYTIQLCMGRQLSPSESGSICRLWATVRDPFPPCTLIGTVYAPLYYRCSTLINGWTDYTTTSGVHTMLCDSIHVLLLKRFIVVFDHIKVSSCILACCLKPAGHQLQAVPVEHPTYSVWTCPVVLSCLENAIKPFCLLCPSPLLPPPASRLADQPCMLGY